LFQLRDCIGWPFADEFQRDMQGFGFDPARIRSEALYALDKRCETLANWVVDVEGYEKAHDLAELGELTAGISGAKTHV
jgi:hypothetical protein